MEILHPDLQQWVLAVAPLLVTGGAPVALIETQRALISTLVDRAAALPTLDTKVQDLKSAVETMGLRVESLDTLKLVTVINRLTALEAALNTTRDNSEALKTSMAGVRTINTILATIDGKVVDYTTLLAAISAKILDYSALLTAINNQVAAVNTKLDTVNTKIDTVNTKIDTVNTNLGTVQTLLLRGFKNTPAIGTLALVTANTQYSFNLPAGTKRYAFKCRGDSAMGDVTANVRYAWATGLVAPATGAGNPTTNYNVLAAGAEEAADDFFAAQQTIFFASDLDGVTLAVRTWT